MIHQQHQLQLSQLVMIHLIQQHQLQLSQLVILLVMIHQQLHQLQSLSQLVMHNRCSCSPISEGCGSVAQCTWTWLPLSITIGLGPRRRQSGTRCGVQPVARHTDGVPTITQLFGFRCHCCLTEKAKSVDEGKGALR